MDGKAQYSREGDSPQICELGAVSSEVFLGPWQGDPKVYLDEWGAQGNNGRGFLHQTSRLTSKLGPRGRQGRADGWTNIPIPWLGGLCRETLQGQDAGRSRIGRCLYGCSQLAWLVGAGAQCPSFWTAACKRSHHKTRNYIEL